MKTKVLSLVHHYFLPEDFISSYIRYVFNRMTGPIDHLVVIGDCEVHYQPFKLQYAISTVRELAKQKNVSQITFILDSSNKHHVPSSITDINFVYIEVWLVLTYLYNLNYSYDKEWKYNLNNYLLLTGNLPRQNRIILLKKCYEQGLLTKDNIWTFPLDDINSLKDFVIRLEEDVSNFNEFVDYCKNFAADDRLKPFSQSKEPTDQLVAGTNHWFEQSSYSIIPEQNFKFNHECITEKTYKCFLNKHPFIMLAWPGILSKLQTLGFKTFDKYLNISYYDSIDDDSSRLDAAVENIKHFNRAKEKNKNEMLLDIEYNYTHFINLAIEQLELINSIIAPAKVTVELLASPPQQDESIFNFFKNNFWSVNVTSEHLDAMFKSFYKNIKADEWPECNTSADFKKLPDRIQKECLDTGLRQIIEDFKTGIIQ